MDSKQRENLINEYKGNIFEFLVASDMAVRYNCYPGFIAGISRNYLSRLHEYEQHLRYLSPTVASTLPLMVSPLSSEICSILGDKIDTVSLVGKEANAKNSNWEADVVLSNGKIKYPLSIKLLKTNSWINTKSGGIKSFFSTYFSGFKESDLQKKVDNVIDVHFNEMVYRLHETVDLRPGHGFDVWISSGYPELPGELRSDLRKIVLYYYSVIASEIYTGFVKCHEKDPSLFRESLLPIVGIGDRRIIQAISFYDKSDSGDEYIPSSVKIVRADDAISDLLTMKIDPIQDGKGFFVIRTKRFDLQIRVKPMNKFTVPSLKVNCAVRFNS